MRLIISIPRTKGNVGCIPKQDLQGFLNHVSIAEQHVQLPTVPTYHSVGAPEMVLWEKSMASLMAGRKFTMSLTVTLLLGKSSL